MMHPRHRYTVPQLAAREELEELFIQLETVFAELCRDDSPEWHETEFRTAALAQERIRRACVRESALMAERRRLGTLVEMLTESFAILSRPDEIVLTALALHAFAVAATYDMADAWGIQ